MQALTRPAGTHHARLGLGLLVLAALLVVGLRLSLPWLVKESAQRILSDEISEVSIEEVDLELVRGRITLAGVSLRGGVPRVDLVSVGRLGVAVDWGGFLDGSLIIESVVIESPEVWIAYDGEGSLNWAVLVKQKEEPAAEPEPAVAFDVRVEEIELGAGRLRLLDEGEGGLPNLNVAMGAIRFEGLAIARSGPGGELGWGLAGIDASDWNFEVIHDGGSRIDFDLRAHAGPVEAGGRIPIGFSASRADGVTIEVEGDLQPYPFAASFDLEWQGLHSRGLLSAMAVQGVRVHEGKSKGELELRISLQPGPERGIVVRGRVEHDALALEMDGDPALRVDVEALRFELARLLVPVAEEDAPAPETLRAHFSRFEIVNPVIELSLAGPTGDGAGETDRAADPIELEAPAPPLALEIQVDEYVLSKGRVILRDLALASDAEQRISEVEIRGRSLHWPLEERFQAAALPVDLALAARWQGLETRTLARLAGIDGVTIAEGRSDGEVSARVTLDERSAGALHVDGRIAHHALELRGEGEDPIELRVEEIGVELGDLSVPLEGLKPSSSGQVAVHLESLDIRSPSLRVPLAIEEEAEESPGDREARVAGETAQARPEPEAAVVDLRVDRFRLADGAIRWSDPELGPEHLQGVSSIELRADSIRWPDIAFESMSLVLGSLGAEPLTIEGDVKPGHADLQLSSTRVPIPPWNREVAHYSDYSITRGEVSLNGPVRLRGEEYDARIQAAIWDLEMTNENNAFGKTFGIRLSDAIALLTDQSGIIRLQLPIKGDLSHGAGVDLVATIQDALREAIMNAFSSAGAAGVDLAGSTLRRVGELVFLGIGEAAFAPGSTWLLIEGELVLKSAAELVGTRPGAKLQLLARVVTDDLRALGIEKRREWDFLDDIVGAGRAIFGGSRELEPEVEKQARRLANERLDSVERWVVANTSLSRDRIVREHWEGKAHEGDPGVMLRMQLRE